MYPHLVTNPSTNVGKMDFCLSVTCVTIQRQFLVAVGVFRLLQTVQKNTRQL
jgi:SAM-dependent MidA family methyltransferase